MLTLFEDDAVTITAGMEKTTRDVLSRIAEAHPDPDPIRDALAQCLLSLAQNIDSQCAKGREISRNMGQYLDALERLDALYPHEDAADQDVEAVWSGDVEGFHDDIDG